MGRRRYSAADITVLSWDEVVRKRPAMYFGVGQRHPDLPTRILAALMTDALHLQDGEHRRTNVEIIGDLRFTVVDDQIRETDEQGVPRLDHVGSLLDRRRCHQAAATALSARTIIEVWAEGRGYRQELVGTQPLAPPQAIVAPVRDGTLVTYELDPSYLVSGAAIAVSLEDLDLHGEWCAGHPLVGSVVKDLRQGTAV
ncbi:hypothetical protein [Streptosporangium sp. NPDC002721]|uniref:hypothetical protein n=1 Tax=Streptosporangium sp. NPDC002721 TaxID=3366188 RepID=UPI003686EF20